MWFWFMLCVSVAKRWILKEILGERCDFYRLLYGTEFGN